MPSNRHWDREYDIIIFIGGEDYMENMRLEMTKFTPEINLDAGAGVIAIRGKSYPENTFEFYEPVMKWVEAYFGASPKEKTVVTMEIIYFNSSSSKLFFDFFDLLEEANEKGHTIEVDWLYDAENESALEAGEDFKEDFESLTINLVKK